MLEVFFRPGPVDATSLGFGAAGFHHHDDDVMERVGSWEGGCQDFESFVSQHVELDRENV